MTETHCERCRKELREKVVCDRCLAEIATDKDEIDKFLAKKCKNCKYFKYLSCGCGECCINPPHPKYHFPRVDAEQDWCGSFTHKNIRKVKSV